MLRNKELEVIDIVKLSPTTNSIKLDLKGEKFEFIPGQFIILEIDLVKTGKFNVKGKEPIQKRCYSISSIPMDNYLEVTVKVTENGLVSNYLINYLKKGEKIKVSGPYGKFYFDKNDTKKNVNLISMGSGACPLYSILKHIKKKNIPVRVHYLFSASYENELLWKKEIEKMASEAITYEFTITRENPNWWKGNLGRINKEMIEKGIKSKAETDFYLCGSPEFVRGIIQILREIGIDDKSIKKEIYD